MENQLLQQKQWKEDAEAVLNGRFMVQILQNGHPLVARLEAFPCRVSMSKWFSFEKFVEGAPREVQTSGVRAGEGRPILTIPPLQHPLSYPGHLLVARTF